MVAFTCRSDLITPLASRCTRWDDSDTLVIMSASACAPESAFWLWTPAQERLERLVVSSPEEHAGLVQTIRNRPPGRWRPTGEARIQSLASYMSSPHTGLPVGNGLLAVGPLNGTNEYVLDARARTYTALWDTPPLPEWAYCSTPGLDPSHDHLLTARWQIHNDEATAPDATHYTEIVELSLKDRTERVLARVPFADNIHQVSVLADGRHLLVNEFQTGLGGPPPDVSRMEKRRGHEALRDLGVRPSSLALVDLRTGAVTTWACPWAAPAHMVLDPDDPEVFYLACHNMAISSGEMHLLGPGCLVKLRVHAGTFQVLGHYSHPTFHRLSTHALVNYRGRRTLAVTVYPNRCELIDAEHMTRTGVIDLYPVAWRGPDGAVGLPNHARESAFSLCATHSDDLLVLSGARCLYVVDLRQEPLTVERLVYNSDPAWVVRAHMTTLA